MRVNKVIGKLCQFTGGLLLNSQGGAGPKQAAEPLLFPNVFYLTIRPVLLMCTSYHGLSKYDTRKE